MMKYIDFVVSIIYLIILVYYLAMFIHFHRKAKGNNTTMVSDGLTYFCIVAVYLLTLGLVLVMFSYMHTANEIKSTIITTLVYLGCLTTLFSQNISAYNENYLYLFYKKYKLRDIKEIKMSKSFQNRVKLKLIIGNGNSRRKSVTIRLSNDNYMKLNNKMGW